MKKLLLMAIIALSVITVNAQQRYEGQWTVHVGGGYMNPKGISTYLGVEKYLGRSCSSVRVGVEYSNCTQTPTVSQYDIKVNMARLSGTYFYSLEKLVKSPFYINLGAGLHLGMEKTNKLALPIGLIQEDVFNVTYGIHGTVQFEYIMNQNLSIFIEPKLNYTWKTGFDKITFNPIVGLKIYM